MTPGTFDKDNFTARDVRAHCKVLCLDKDGLLFDRDSFWSALWQCRERKLAPKLGTNGISLLRSLMGVGEDGKINPNGPLALAYPDDEITIAAAVMYEQQNVSWDEALRISSKLFKEADESLDLRQALVPRQGFPKILFRAKDRGVLVAIVTSDDTQRTKESLQSFQVESLVDFVCTPSFVKYGKPYPDMLACVANHFDVDITELVMIGDSLVDVEMARNAGAIGIAIPYPDTSATFKGFTVVSSLDEVTFL